MLSYEPELRELQERGALDAAKAARLIAIERRELFPILPELRAVAYAGVAMLLAGVGIVIKNNYERIGPIAIISAIAVAAIGCYLPAVRARRRNEPRTAVGEYVLLLGALLIAADVAFAESQFHILDRHWTMHLLLIALLHAIGAYVFDSRLLLGASLAALTSWFGFATSFELLFGSHTAVAIAGLSAAAAIAIWRVVNRRAAFNDTFDFFIANVALLSSVVLTFDGDTRWTGLLLTLVFAAAAIAWALRRRTVSFALYGVVYAVVAVMTIGPNAEAAFFAWVLATSVAGVALLAFLVARIRGSR